MYDYVTNPIEHFTVFARYLGSSVISIQQQSRSWSHTKAVLFAFKFMTGNHVPLHENCAILPSSDRRIGNHPLKPLSTHTGFSRHHPILTSQVSSPTQPATHCLPWSAQQTSHERHGTNIRVQGEKGRRHARRILCDECPPPRRLSLMRGKS